MTAIPASEFAGRRAKAARAARGRGFRGLLVCARGGGTADRYGDVMYLTNFYTAFPFIPDRPPDWSARAHAFVLLPADGPEALVADMGVAPDWQVPIDDIVVAADMIEALSRELAARGMGAGEAGIAGADALPWSAHQALRRNLPDVRWTDASDILERLRLVKSAGEIALLRRSSEIGSRATDAMIEAARPGVTHGEVMLAGLEVLVPRGGLHLQRVHELGPGRRQRRRGLQRLPDLRRGRAAVRRPVVPCRPVGGARRVLFRPRPLGLDRRPDARADRGL